MGRRRATTAAAAAILCVAGGGVLTVAWPVTTAPVIAQTTAPPGAPSGAVGHSGGDRTVSILDGEIFNYAFSPRELRVKVGTTVTFANYDAVVHDVKAASAAFESGNIPTQGRHFETFSLAGTLEYFCAVHLEMRGRIVVEP
jgi:plastocyanin